MEAICTEVRCCIERAISQVTSDLHYTSDAEHILAFYCTGRHFPRLECHPARIDYFRNKPCIVVCEHSRIRHKHKLPAGSLNWFGKVSSKKHRLCIYNVSIKCL